MIRRECPVEIYAELKAKPVPPPGAEVRHNQPGGDWLDALIAWGDRAVSLLTDAKAQCPPQE